MSQVLRYVSLISVIFCFFSFIPKISSETCATFLTKDSMEIEIPDNSNTPGSWGELYNQYQYRHKHIVNISLANSQGIIRLCYLADKIHTESKCRNYDSESLAKLKAFQYDVSHIYSVVCNNNKKETCDKGKTPKERGTCAVLYQDDDSCESNFASIQVDENVMEVTTVNFTIINSKKYQVLEGYVVKVYYYDQGGNLKKCRLSHPHKDHPGHKSICTPENLMQKKLMLQCRPDDTVHSRRFMTRFAPSLTTGHKRKFRS